MRGKKAIIYILRTTITKDVLMELALLQSFILSITFSRLNK